MKKLSILSGALALVLLAACSSGGPSGASPQVQSPETATAALSASPSEPPQWSSQVFADTYYAEDGTMVMDVRYTLPMVENTDTCPAGEAINAWYKDYGENCLAEAASGAAEAEGDYDSSKSTQLPFTPTSHEMSYEVLLDNDQVISISREWYIGTGAAYPTVFRLGDNFDPQTGIKLAAADFFTDAETVKDRVVEAFLTCAEIMEGSFTKEQVEEGYQAEQFCLTQEGYVFWIQGNTLPALHSPVSVTIPYSALKDVSMYAAQ